MRVMQLAVHLVRCDQDHLGFLKKQSPQMKSSRHHFQEQNFESSPCSSFGNQHFRVLHRVIFVNELVAIY